MIADLPVPEDRLVGSVIQLSEAYDLVLVIGPAVGDLPGQTLYHGDLKIIYGLRYLYEQDYLMPQSAYDDYRREHLAKSAITFMLKNGDMFPRADVIGRRISTGERDERYFKELDLAAGVAAFVCMHGSDIPLGRLGTVLYTDTSQTEPRQVREDQCLPELLCEAAACYCLHPDSVAAFMTLQQGYGE